MNNPQETKNHQLQLPIYFYVFFHRKLKIEFFHSHSYERRRNTYDKKCVTYTPKKKQRT